MARAADVLLLGAAAGMAGGLAMSAIRQVLQKADLMGAPLPLKVERDLERRMDVDDLTGPGAEKALAMGQHLMISAGFGGAYALLQRLLRLPVWAAGLAYGVLVYGILVVGMGPALDLTRPPWREEPGVVVRRLSVHLVFGLVTAALFEQMDRSG